MEVRYSWTHPPDRRPFDTDLFVIGCGYDLISQRDIIRNSKKKEEINFHILYFTHGSCSINIAGKECEACPGDLAYFYSGTPYTYTYHHEPETKVYWLHFSGKKAFEIVNELGLTESFVSKAETELSGYFENILDEILIKKKHYNKAMTAHLMILLSAIVRKSQAKHSRLDKVIGLMHNKKKRDLDLDEYAKECHLSKSQFIRTFKEYTGKTPMKYKNDILIERAKYNLTRSDLSITEISNELGFENIYYFSTFFKKALGMSPAEYRKKYK